jgi:peptidoglycan/xylan/chitin deacetylase (PgdA/CDA1 family)/glycosyltransferase involved in cell wall biosynthesis
MAAMERLGMIPREIAAIITCHNLGRSLAEALESVERQTRPASEIVVIDDSSSEIYTRQLLRQIERDGTRVVQADRRCVSAARNLGARVTSAEYLVCLDADDVLEAGYFEAAGALLDADPDLDFVSCAMRAFGEASYVWTPSQPTFVEAVGTGGVPHASTVVRRRLWERIGGFDERLTSYEMLDFWASAMELGCRGVVLGEPLLNYRIRAGSGYRRSIHHAVYLSRLGHFYAKHRAAVERHGLELIERKEAFFMSQRDYRQTLEMRRTALETDLARLQQEIAESVRLLEERGASRVDWGDFREARPLSRKWGSDRGRPIDRYYIEGFLERYRSDLKGRVLEVREALYTRRFGGDAVTASDIVDIDPGNGHATVIADLRRAAAIPTGTYDCVILTQTLQLIDDIAAVVSECARILRPGGVLLVTVPANIRVDDEAGVDGDFWRLTEASARTVFAKAFPIDAFEVTVYGNVKTCAAFLYGIAAEELSSADLDHTDPAFPLVVAVRAVKQAEVAASPIVSGPSFSGAILSYHRVASLAPDSHRLCISPEEFRAQMSYLRENFTPIGLEELVQGAAAGRIPEGAVAVTLDDGYLDALTTASVILSDLGVPATFFVNTGRLNEEHERWWDVLERIFLSELPVPPVLALRIGGQDLQMPTATSSDRHEVLERLNQIARPLDASGRRDLIDRVTVWSKTPHVVRPSHRVLTEDEIRALSKRPGHAIGAHTCHHLALTTQPAETKRREILEDKAMLEGMLQQPVRLFAYPYGEFDAETLAVVSAARFRAAVTVRPGLVAAGTNRLLLPRFEVTPEHHGRFPRFMREIFADQRQQTMA